MRLYYLEIGGVVEGLATGVAAVRLLPPVSGEVRLQGVVADEGLLADVTRVRLLL